MKQILFTGVLAAVLCCGFSTIAQTAADEQCFTSPTKPQTVSAHSEWTISGNTLTIRTTFAKTFVDNTYGSNAIGWSNGHTFSNLVGSDHLQLALYDANGLKMLEFKQDYITASSSAPSGYDCLGVTGGEGKMIVGGAGSILSATSSLDENMNAFGYVLTANSPATDTNYVPNPAYPDWIFEVWYEAAIDLSVFGTAGFGYPDIVAVHASPSKTGSNTEPVIETECPQSLTLNVTGETCNQECSGSITLTVNSFNPPFTYLWSNSDTSKDISNLCPGDYSVTVTDDNGNTATASANVKEANCDGGEQCFISPTIPDIASAKSAWTINGNVLTIRTTFAKTFVDNTYGTNAIGWNNGHTFNNLVGSDHLLLSLFDANGVKKLEFKQDYITASSSAPSGYDCLGVTGGEGQMIVGGAGSVLSATSSLDQNLNTYGYALTANSPATDANYTPNAIYPNWIYEVWYEVSVDLNVFGTAGFGYPRITSVHASPSKTGNHTEIVNPDDCPVDCSSSTLSVSGQARPDMQCDTVAPPQICNCSCAGGGLQTLSVMFVGVSGSNVSVYASSGQQDLVASFINVQFGDILFVDGTTLPSGMLNTKTYFKIAGGKETKIYTDCKKDIKGKTYDSFRVVGFRDAAGNTCDVEANCDQCPCYKEFKQLTLLFSGTSGANISVYEDPGHHKLIASFGNVQHGDFITIDRPNKNLPKKLHITINDGANFELASECKKISIGGTYGDFTLAGFIDKQGRECSLSNPCQGDGSINVTASGGVPPYSYEWSGGETSEDLSDLCSGSFSVTVTDSIGCTATATFNIGTVPCAFAVIGDFVWHDLDANGQQDAGEPGIPGVTVQLYNADDDSLLATKATDGNGYYLFDSLELGNYYVIFNHSSAPSSLLSTLADAGNDDTDSDADVLTGKTGIYSLNSGDTVLTVDAGYICADVACEINGENIICPDATSTYTGPEGVDAYEWTISGGGTIIGANNQRVVTVKANNNCGSFTLMLVSSIGNCSENCEYAVTVEDLLPPVVSFPDADDVISCGDDIIFPEPIVTDNCDSAPTVFVVKDETVPGTCPNVFTMIRTFSAHDRCGNSSSAAFSITVIDTTRPVISGVGADKTINCPAVPRFSTAFDSDNCGTASMSFVDVTTPGGCASSYSVTRTWTAEDACGNTSTATQTITVRDPNAPAIDSPANTALQCGESTEPSNTGTATCVDACDTLVIPAYQDALFEGAFTGSPVCINAGNGEFTTSSGDVFSTDQHFTGGQNFSRNIAIANTTDDVLYQTERFGANGSVFSYNIPVTNGNYMIELHFAELFFGLPGNGLSGGIGSRQFDVTIEGDLALDNYDIFADAGGPAIAVIKTLNASVTDGMLNIVFDGIVNNAKVSAICVKPQSEVHCGRHIRRTWTCTDDCGNVSTSTQIISIIDTIAPVISGVGANQTIQCPATPQFSSPSASDDCGDAALSFEDVTTPGSCAGSYTLTRTWTATDECGNSSTASQAITVIDEIAPLFSGVGADDTIPCQTEPQFSEPVATDVCGSVTVNFRDDFESDDCQLAITRTWTATDACGNSSTTSQTMHYIDDIAPVISGVGADETIDCGSIPEFSEPATNDLCSTVTLTFEDSFEQAACENEAAVTRTWTARDHCGNTSTASQTITITDTKAPVFINVGEDDTIRCPEIPVFSQPDASDECGEVTITFIDDITFGDCVYSFSITRIWTATDLCGNSSTTSQTITAIDDNAPLFTFVPADDTVVCQNPEFGQPDVAENCSQYILRIADDTIFTDAPEQIVFVRSWTAVDGCGNISETVSQRIMVVNNHEPATGNNPTCHSLCDARVSVSGDCYAYLWSTGDNTATVEGLCEGTYTVTMTDAFGYQVVDTVVLTAPLETEMQFVLNHVSCFEASDGSIDLTVTGGTPPYSFLWSNGFTTEDISGLLAGEYSVTVLDAHGCEAAEARIITQPGELTLGAFPTPNSCDGGNDGAVTLTVLGGTSPYSFLWSTGATTQNISGLQAGTYRVTVTDANLCEATVSSVVLGPDPMVLSLTTADESCQDSNDGSVDLSVSGGTLPYSFAWSTNDTTEDISGLAAGTYSVTVTDKNGCYAMETVTLAVTICNDNDPCTTDNCDNAVCSYEPVLCDDADPCTEDECVNGICEFTSIICNDDDACTNDACVNGQCEFTAVICDDDDACTNDACVSGQCEFMAVVCDDDDACTNDACVNSQCEFMAVVCDDDDACTNDACVNGQCEFMAVACDDNDACTNDACVNGQCEFTAVACDDDDACTNDACVNGQCEFTVVCNDNDACTNDECLSGQCIFTAITCDDNNGCTRDECIAGHCLNNYIICNDFDDCTLDECINGQCEFEEMNCDDSDECTIDGCNLGLCAHEAIECFDNESCTSDECVNGDCVFTPIICDDNSLCTFDECVSGECLFTPFTPSVTEMDVDLCAGDSVFAGGSFRTKAGVYFDTLSDANGCDSVLITAVSITQLEITHESSDVTGNCASTQDRLCLLNFAGLPHGTKVSDQYAQYGIHISSIAYANDWINQPNISELIIFNTHVSGSWDPDLQVDMGNILIFPEDTIDANNDGLVDFPNDTRWGGKIIFDFDFDRTVISVTIVDHDRQGGSIDAYDQLGNLIVSVPIPTVPDGGVAVVNVNASGVRKLVVDDMDSGGLTDIVFDCPEVCCDGTAEVFPVGGTAPYSFLWSNGNQTSSSDSLCAGTYVVTVTDANGCVGHDTITINEPPQIGFRMMENEVENLKAFPMPFENILNVQFTSRNEGFAEIRLLSVIGQTIQRQIVETQAGENNSVMHVSNIVQGVYFIEIIKNGYSEGIKVLKTR